MKKDACIICGKEKPGLEVKDDYMIDAVRWIKLKIFKSKPKNFRLVVCKDDFLKYKKQRDTYERNQMLYVAIGIIFLAMLLVFSNGRVLGAIFYGALVILFMYLVAQLGYIPAVDIPEDKKKKA